ncbi:MAG TPA: protease pro-enzyme activation domain-containing protein [Granulicella sp.]|jgi:subtilase family serine protease|nr:protease pro-enzyme activation domain-containing protein [Granulicella sp.]
MKTYVKGLSSELIYVASWIAICFGFAGFTLAQEPQARISAAIDSSARFALVGSHPGAASGAYDVGRMPASAKLTGVSISFSRSATQEAALQALLTAQQTPGSPQYHKWLTPDQFAAQFGMASADLAKVQAWLQQQGMTVNGVSRSRNRISFTGSVAQVEAAFGTELHSYKIGAETHFAPASDISIPTALAGSVQAVTNLSDFRPKPHVRLRTQQAAQANFTSGVSGNHYLAPGDVATIYDIVPAYQQGYTGAGQSIAIVGQSSVVTTDIANFQTAAGLPVKAPSMVLMPGTGPAALPVPGDEVESDLDLEYSGAIAQGATIYFVYTGSNTNYGAFDALTYAVDQDIAPIISSSYGSCETDLASTGYAQLNAVLAQAVAQGQTVISAAGDNGSTDCYADTAVTPAQQTALAVDFPASSQYVTGMGGTEFPAADVASGSTTYWSSNGSTDVVSSALKYIPEGVWNDDSSTATTSPLSSGGGGVSAFTARPTWQAGVPGITAGSYRMVPDISLASSPNNAGYLFCTSDTSDWSTGQKASCNSGFRDSATQDLTVAGGTSFAAPIFAGMLAIINQKQGAAGQGVINRTLYGLAANSATYSSAFHDIVSGSNACTAGPTYCTTAGAGSYTAGVGYDEASGLGSIDLYNLLTSWPAVAGSAALPSTTAVTAASPTVAPGTNDVLTITVSAAVGDVVTTIPTGTVTLMVGGTTVSPITLANGVATYNFSSATVGSYAITATYSGDINYAPSSGTTSVAVATGTTPGATFTVKATNVTVAAGSSSTSTVTVTPSGGYTGTVTWNSVLAVPTFTNGCYNIASLPVPGTAAVTTTLTVYTTSSSCTAATAATAAVVTGNAKRMFVSGGGVSSNRPVAPAKGSVPMGIALAGLLAAGFVGRRSRVVRVFTVAVMMGVAGFAVSGCSSGTSSSATGTNVAAGTYSLTLTGTDQNNATITAPTTFTVTVN